jgi:hypothetical protein
LRAVAFAKGGHRSCFEVSASVLKYLKGSL